MGDIEQIFLSVTSRYTELFQNNPCPITRTTYVDIVNTLSLSLFRHQPLRESPDLPPILISRSTNEQPVLEKSVALHVLFQCLLRPMPIPSARQDKSYLTMLAIQRPNTITWMLTDLDYILHHLPRETSAGALRDFLWEIATTTEVHELAAIAYRTFMKKADPIPPSDSVELPVNRIFQMKFAPPPTLIAAAVQISGSLLDLMCVAGRWHQSTRETLSRLLSKLRQMLEPNEVRD